MSSYTAEWITVGVIVVLAAIELVRRLRKDPCSGCGLSDACSKRGKRKDRKPTRHADCCENESQK